MKVLYLLLLSNFLFAFDVNSKYLIINQFDKSLLADVDEYLESNFDNTFINIDSTMDMIFDSLDQDKNPASLYMDDIKNLGNVHNVNFILVNRIKNLDDRLIVEGMLFNTRSGGLIHRRKINVKNYDDGYINEFSILIGSAVNQIKQEWEQEREKILFLDPQDITYEKTPLGAALRSFIIPGWGQIYSGKPISAGLWATLELSLSIAFISSYGMYDSSSKSFLKNQKLYDQTDDEIEIANYRNKAEKNWDQHVFYSRLAIALATATTTSWISNSVHAWVFGPRPYTNIYHKGISKSQHPQG